MPSPFPGMNPYLEQDDAWHDFHEDFCTYCKALLVPQVRPNYYVKADEHVYLHELPAEERYLIGRAAVAVSRAGTSPRVSSEIAVLDKPAYGLVPLAVDSESHSYLEIRDRRDRQLITVIELLSPSNKRSGSDRDQYVAKRLQFLRSPAHFVEIDLLRGGPRLPLEDVTLRDYYALVGRVEERPRVAVWTVGLRDRLPIIPIPLRAPDADARLDLQEVLNRIYDAGGYEDYIYTGTPEPPLSAEEAAWAQQWVPSAR